MKSIKRSLGKNRIKDFENCISRWSEALRPSDPAMLRVIVNVVQRRWRLEVTILRHVDRSIGLKGQIFEPVF